MTRKVAVAMRKGGSGKTTTAVNLAAALALRGKKVLLVDLDPQANATIAVGINPLEIKRHAGHLLAEPSIDPHALFFRASYGMDILPSHIDLVKSEQGMTNTDIDALKNILEPIAGEYDYIFLDTPPSESMLTANVLYFANEVIMPLQAHYFAMEGLAQAMEQIEKIKRSLNTGIKIIGILPTLVNARTNISKTIIETAKAAYPDLVYPFEISYSVRHPEATALGIPIVIYDPDHNGAIAYKKLAEVIDNE